MHWIDWSVLIFTLVSIVAYGVWKTRHVQSSESFMLGDRDLPWWTIGLSIMATQASAITFLSTPGQAYEEGMGFAQFYFGLPIAMVILCIFFLPIYYRLKVYTAYQYLEQRFDNKVRVLTACLFLISRGLAAGITIFAPSIILSSILGWDLFYTNLLIGSLVIIYTYAGGTTAVAQTQKQQMIIILSGMIIAFVILLIKFPEQASFVDGLKIAGQMERLDIVNLKFDWDNKYNLWSALFGGTFLFLSYFGTDQSQVQRYLSGKSLTESRMGLLMNGIIKVPMQFFILLVGLMVFVYMQFTPNPIHFNETNLEIAQQGPYGDELGVLQSQYDDVLDQKSNTAYALLDAFDSNDQGDIERLGSQMRLLDMQSMSLQSEADSIILMTNDRLETEDTDYVFLYFVMNNLPIGLIGLLLAVIFSAAMSSTASEINALATTSLVDIIKRNFAKDREDAYYLRLSKLLTLGWGLIALLVATYARLFDNLIEAVNIIGSLFYGTILGIFMVAFFFKQIRSRAVFVGAIVAEIVVVTTVLLSHYEIINLAYLWLNLIGCGLVILIAWLVQSSKIFK